MTYDGKELVYTQLDLIRDTGSLLVGIEMAEPLSPL
jgi:hypothetical protein